MSRNIDLDDVQGLVVRGYGKLKEARFLLLAVDDPERARSWLETLTEAVTSASARAERLAINVAFTAVGFRRLGLSQDALSAFSFEFRDGMVSDHRSRVLGDEGPSAPSTWAWGGPNGPPVDVLVMVYAVDVGALEDALAIVHRGREGLSTVAELHTTTLTDHEHFGFHDGISQPVIEGAGRPGTPENTIRAGEFLLGYENEYAKYTDRPSVASETDGSGVLPRLPGRRSDLGKNGTYLVLRQLAQDVPGFWGFVDRAAGSPGLTATREALAAKMVGRWRSGAPLVLAGDRDDPALGDANDFGYFHEDPHGLRCPKGAHIRRTHPRDSLDPDPGSEASIEVGKRHRVLRRGRQYGPSISPDEAASASADEEERGLHFICLNANLARQFEFVQHTWMNNPKFDGLYDDSDPIVTSRSRSDGVFTIPGSPVRTRVTGMPSFVTVRGGAYFFMPGISAVRYLAALDA